VQRPTREELIALAKADPEAIADLVLMLWDRVEAHEKRLAELERNSRTSSKPPSTDKGNFTNPPKPNPKSLRKKTGRKPGGQKDHPGSTLQKVSNPDHIIKHRLADDTICPKCQAALILDNHDGDVEARQVFDLPPLKLEVTEHQAQRCHCLECGTRITAPFPKEVNAPVQYGPRLQATALYLNGYQLLPLRRLSELFGEVFQAPISEGTLTNMIKRGSQKAAQCIPEIKEALLQSPVAHVDETGFTQNGRRHWLHVFSSSELTLYHADAKRGREAIERMGMVPEFQNLLIHDCLSIYFSYGDCLHGLCNPHLLRELTYVHEQLEQAWAGEMIALIYEAKKLADRELSRREGTRRVIGTGRLQKILDQYDAIVNRGRLENPEPPPKPAGQKGRQARGKPLCLLDRFDRYREEILGFFFYPEIYPFSNNLAEQDLRMMKVREKISGTFRSEEHSKGFCDIRSVISSARKQGRAMLQTLTNMISSPLELAKSLTQGT